MILAIDTSGSLASVAVYDGRILAETTWRSGRQHSRALVGAITHVLYLAGVERTAITALALAGGPGSYSGLRVGASTAIGLGLALGVPVVQIPTLEVLAYSVSRDGDLRPAIDVGRGRYASARFVSDGGTLEQRSDIAGYDFDDLVAVAGREHALLIGDFSAEELARHESTIFVTQAGGARRAGFLAELAQRRIANGDRVDEGAGPLIYLTP